MNRKKSMLASWLCAFLLFGLLTMTWGIHSAQAFTPGKTYDKTNYQEIQDLLAPSILMAVKSGEYIIKTGKLDFEFKMYKPYLDLSARNEGKYDIDQNGLLIEKATGKPPKNVIGNPFPKIDLKDPKAAEKIAENFFIGIRCRNGSNFSAADTYWVGRGGMERLVDSRGKYMNYMNNPRGPLPNPNNFLSQSMTFVASPFSLRGTVSMGWSYNDAREDSVFAYLPMLRRIRRVSAATRSDPYMGSDSCTDDAYGYNGKSAVMKWKLLGEKNMLFPLVSDKILRSTETADGSFNRVFQVQNQKAGFQIPGWKGAPYAPAEAVWVLRPVYIVEMTPKDPYYNYGKQPLYIDKDEFNCYLKEAHDRSGSYWKKILVIQSYHQTKGGKDWVMTDAYATTDDKTHHCTYSIVKAPEAGKPMYNLPYTMMGPQSFTEDALLQLAK